MEVAKVAPGATVIATMTVASGSPGAEQEPALMRVKVPPGCNKWGA